MDNSFLEEAGVLLPKSEVVEPSNQEKKVKELELKIASMEALKADFEIEIENAKMIAAVMQSGYDARILESFDNSVNIYMTPRKVIWCNINVGGKSESVLLANKNDKEYKEYLNLLDKGLDNKRVKISSIGNVSKNKSIEVAGKFTELQDEYFDLDRESGVTVGYNESNTGEYYLSDNGVNNDDEDKARSLGQFENDLAEDRFIHLSEYASEENMGAVKPANILKDGSEEAINSENTNIEVVSADTNNFINSRVGIVQEIKNEGKVNETLEGYLANVLTQVSKGLDYFPAEIEDNRVVFAHSIAGELLNGKFDFSEDAIDELKIMFANVKLAIGRDSELGFNSDLRHKLAKVLEKHESIFDIIVDEYKHLKAEQRKQLFTENTEIPADDVFTLEDILVTDKPVALADEPNSNYDIPARIRMDTEPNRDTKLIEVGDEDELDLLLEDLPEESDDYEDLIVVGGGDGEIKNYVFPENDTVAENAAYDNKQFDLTNVEPADVDDLLNDVELDENPILGGVRKMFGDGIANSFRDDDGVPVDDLSSLKTSDWIGDIIKPDEDTDVFRESEQVKTGVSNVERLMGSAKVALAIVVLTSPNIGQFFNMFGGNNVMAQNTPAAKIKEVKTPAPVLMVPGLKNTAKPVLAPALKVIAPVENIVSKNGVELTTEDGIVLPGSSVTDTIVKIAYKLKLIPENYEPTKYEFGMMLNVLKEGVSIKVIGADGVSIKGSEVVGKIYDKNGNFNNNDDKIIKPGARIDIMDVEVLAGVFKTPVSSTKFVTANSTQAPLLEQKDAKALIKEADDKSNSEIPIIRIGEISNIFEQIMKSKGNDYAASQAEVDSLFAKGLEGFTLEYDLKVKELDINSKDAENLKLKLAELSKTDEGRAKALAGIDSFFKK